MIMRNPELNVVIFGEAGVGKSSLVNLLVGHPVAPTSSDADTCTLTAKRYFAALDCIEESIVTLWDTAGLSDSRFGWETYLEAVNKANELIRNLRKAGGVHLLLFVMRAGRMNQLAERNYKLFSEIFCRGKVPTAVVVTHLEHERDPEGWWNRNVHALRESKIHFDGHVCVTTLASPAYSPERNDSRHAISCLIRDCASTTAMFDSSEVWMTRVMEWIWRTFVPKARRPRIRKLIRQLRERCGFSKEEAEQIAQILAHSADDTSSHSSQR